MILALDSSLLIDLEKGNKETIQKLEKLRAIHQGPAYISLMSYFELYYGILNKIEKNREEAYIFLHKFPVLQTTTRTAEILAELKQKYEKRGIHFTLTDLFIASQVREHGLLLITKEKDFKAIEEIQKIVI